MADKNNPVEVLAIKPWPDAGRALGLGRSAIYEGINNGDIPSVRIGGRILVPLAGLKKMLGGGEAA
jgi:excisionase family DNA binding protein